MAFFGEKLAHDLHTCKQTDGLKTTYSKKYSYTCKSKEQSQYRKVCINRATKSNVFFEKLSVLDVFLLAMTNSILFSFSSFTPLLFLIPYFMLTGPKFNCTNFINKSINLSGGAKSCFFYND